MAKEVFKIMSNYADYKMVDCGEVYVANVEVSWYRTYGRCDRRRHTRHSTLYTQQALRNWAKRNNVDVPKEDIDKLPKKI